VLFRVRGLLSLYLGVRTVNRWTRSRATNSGARRTHGSPLVVVLVAGALAVGCDETRSDIRSGQVDDRRSTPTARSTAETRGSDPLAEVRQELAAAQADYYTAYAAAVASPSDRGRVRRLLGVYTPESPARPVIAARMKALADRRLAGRSGPKGYYVIEKLDVATLPPRGKATTTVCTYDDGVLYDAAHKGPDGQEIVVNDDVKSGRTRFYWVQQKGAWKLQGGDVLKTWEGENRCPAKASG
jgi:hypothetical protein